jgi:hypothetical protein
VAVKSGIIYFTTPKDIRAFPSEFLEKPNMNLNIQKFKVQVRKMWFHAKLNVMKCPPKKYEKKKKGL